MPAVDNTAVDVTAAAWTAFDWNGTLSKQDALLLQQKDLAKQSLSARKQLAETTKQFKRAVKTVEQAAQSLTAQNTPETAATTVQEIQLLSKQSKATIKNYQQEIDNLTRRCKACEGAYSATCQSMQELPDPAVCLQQTAVAVQQQTNNNQEGNSAQALNQELQAANNQVEQYKQQVVVLQNKFMQDSASGAAGGNASKQDRTELIQLRLEVAEYEVEFRSLKNQDITIRKLEARIAELQTVGEEEMKDQLEKAKEELAETEGRRATAALEREAAMERKVQTLELQLKSERAGRDATQSYLLEADEGVSQREAAWEAQRRILVDDSERLRESLQAAVRERDELRLSVAAVQGGDRRSGPTPPPSGGISMSDMMLERKAYEAEVAELSETAAILRDELRSHEEVTVDEKRAFQSKIETLEREKNSLKSNLGSLETQVASAPSQALVENMKRELRILKRLEYNADDVDADRDPEIAGGGDDDEKDLESVLVGKLRRAESELVTERIGKTDLMKEVDSLNRSLTNAEQAKKESEELVSSLERDLERAIMASSTPKAARKIKDIVPVEGNPATLQHILDPNAPPPPPAPPANAEPSSMTPSAAEKADDDHSVATIVMAQRDRLRARCEALEAERDSFKRELQGQVQASESLKTDNTKLYEKVRYLQNYNKNPTSRGAYNRSSGADRDLDLEALEQRYESSVDPFRQFGKSERQRKMNEMSPMERTVFMVAKTVLATKEVRTGLFFYVIAMHLLVFITTYHWSHAAAGCHINNDHLSHLPPALPAHIQEQLVSKSEQAIASMVDATQGAS